MAAIGVDDSRLALISVDKVTDGVMVLTAPVAVTNPVIVGVRAKAVAVSFCPL
jgi:hypothetical protein